MLQAGRFFTPRALGSAVFVLLLLSVTPIAGAQTESPSFARKNSFGMIAAYSNDSSHMLLGEAEQRKLLSFGASYSRRILLTHLVNWQYDGEVFPVALGSDPRSKFVDVQTQPTQKTTVFTGGPRLVTCGPQVFTYDYTLNGVTYAGTERATCSGRQWTVGEAISPVGMQWNFLTRRKLQPVISAHGGYIYTTHAIPVDNAGSFNFTFDLDVGFEWYRSRAHSIRAEYRYHHISNHETALSNPGIDNGVFQVSYVFGR